MKNMVDLWVVCGLGVCILILIVGASCLDGDDSDSSTTGVCERIDACDLTAYTGFTSMAQCQSDSSILSSEVINCIRAAENCDDVLACIDNPPVDDDDFVDDDDDFDDDDDTGDDDDDVTVGKWGWHDIPGAYCRDGSQAGIIIRRAQGSSELAIFMDGGGLCANDLSCADCPFRYGETEFIADGGEEYWFLHSGIMNSQNPDNPARDFNFIFVPYCTGDAHMGSREDVDVGIGTLQQFVGHMNFKLFLDRIKEEFPNISKVLLMGMSAGGYGTILAYPEVAAKYPSATITMIDDSGPMSEMDTAFTPCLQEMLTELYNLEAAIPADCTNCIQANGDGLVNLMPYLADKYPKGSFGLFETMGDFAIRFAWALGLNDCQGGPMLLDGGIFRDALYSLRDNILVPTGRWSTYYIEGTDHGILPYEGLLWGYRVSKFPDVIIDGVLFSDWVGDLLTGVPASVGP